MAHHTMARNRQRQSVRAAGLGDFPDEFGEPVRLAMSV
jgi:hypothetical protein